MSGSHFQSHSTNPSLMMWARPRISVIGGKGTPFSHLQLMARNVRHVRFFCSATWHTATDRSWTWMFSSPPLIFQFSHCLTSATSRSGCADKLWSSILCHVMSLRRCRRVARCNSKLLV